MKYNTAQGVITDDEGIVLFTVHSHAAAENLMRFKSGVASMPVPRCETCAHWTPVKQLGNSWSACEELSTGMVVSTEADDVIQTRANFGCVQWKEKG